MKQSALIQKLIPININPDSTVAGFEQAVAFYADDLPNSDLVDEEFHMWKCRWLGVSKQERPHSIGKALQQCSATTLPILLRLFATLPLCSCACEHSASTLQRLNNYLRYTQTEHRLSALAKIHCNFSESIDVNHVCKLFTEKYPCQIEAPSMLFE